MIQAPLEHNRLARISVSVNNAEPNSVIKNLLIAAPDAEVIEQNLVIRDFLITSVGGHYNEF